MSEENILIVDDETGIRELIKLYLENREYSVITAKNGEQALELVKTQTPDLILLDIEMPGLNGFEVCQKIRTTFDIPILFISCRRDVMDKVKCFDLGGDDYLTKPFEFAELEARIKANLRRYQQRSLRMDQSNILKYGEIEIHVESYKCFVRGEPSNLSAKEMKLLLLLIKRPNQVWSAEKLYDHIWGFESTGNIQTVKVHISNLRRKLEIDPTDPQYIQTIRGFGYVFAS